MEITKPRCLGITTFEPSQVEELTSSGGQKIAVSCAHGRWKPSPCIAKYLRKDFLVPIHCYTGKDGLRRILMPCNFKGLIDLGTVGGVAVIHALRGFDAQQHENYRNMLLIHQHVCGRTRFGTRGMQEHFTRKFMYARDLYVRPSGRLADDERDVLPDDIGLTAQGKGRRLTIAQLMKIGRKAAQQAGYSNTTSELAIVYGLYEIAKLNPLEVEVEKVAALVWSAFFEMATLQDASFAEQVEIVTQRLLQAVDSHLSDSPEKFQNWFFGAHNTLVKQLAQQKNKEGGKLPQGIVRRVIVELGVRSYEFAGQCVHALMRTIKNSISPPLNAEEKRLFEHMYESQPYYGNLPAAMLAERMPGLELGILAIWNEPQNLLHVHVLHRLLSYYADMARKRRAADLLSKERCSQNNGGSPQIAGTAESTEDKAAQPASEDDPLESSPTTGGDVPFIENIHSKGSASKGPFQQVAEHIRQLHGIECKAGCTEWAYYREGESDESVKIRLQCECDLVNGAITMPIGAFTQYAEEVLEWKKSKPGQPSSDDAEPDGD